MIEWLLLGFAFGWWAHLLLSARRPSGGQGYQPKGRQVDWTKVKVPTTGSAVQRPAPNPRLKDRG